MSPVTAPSALDGFSLLQEACRDGQPFRLLISDVHMPEIDGFGLAEMIRADARLTDLDIIQLTSGGMQGYQGRCEKLQVAAQLRKPVRQSELYNVIMRVLGLDRPDPSGWVSMHEPQSDQLPPLKILLAEDSPTNQKVALAVLSGLGHTIVVANHGEEALDLLAKQDFDVVLMDVQMPIMDGLEAAAAIRAAEQGLEKHQPIVAMTAHAMAGDRQRCLDAGMDAYVSKPFRRESLLTAIAAATGFERSNGGRNSPESETSPKLVDWNAALAQLKGDHETLTDITQSYLAETHEHLSRLPTAIAENRARETQRLAHTVKGAMRFFHAKTAQASGQQLEELAGTGDLTSAPELFARFKSDVDRVVPVLQRFVDTGEM